MQLSSRLNTRAFTTRLPLISQRHGRRSLQVCNMFTGIVQGTAQVATVEAKPGLTTLNLKFPAGKLDKVQLGASIAINGTCLTVTTIGPDSCTFDVMQETLRATSLGALKQGSIVNFERSARVGDEIGGHNVSGHVHTTASIAKVEDTENNRRVTFRVKDAGRWMKYILPKGYVSVDGCSLTIGEVMDDCFTVYLIPETLRVTVFGVKREGDVVNIEVETQTQAIVDTVERVVAQHLAKLNLAPPAATAGSSKHQ